MDKEFLSVKEIADMLGVSVDTVQGWIRRKELIAYKVGTKAYRVKRSDLQKFLEERRTDKKED